MERGSEVERKEKHKTCETCGMFDPRPDPEYLDDDYCVETENLVNAGDRACKEYWRR